MEKDYGRAYLYCSLGVLAAFILSSAVGSVNIPLTELFTAVTAKVSGTSVEGHLSTVSTILFELRFPRAILIALTGAALSISGSAYQGLFRNPLADPYLIGVASGAGLGAVLVISLQTSTRLSGLFIVPLAAFISAILTVWLVVGLAKTGNSLPTTSLILAGVATSSFTSALTSCLMLFSTGEFHRALVWLLGGATMSGWQPVVVVIPYLFIGMGVLLAMGHALNVLQFGDEQARQLGLPVERVRRIIIGAASLTTAAAVSFSGIIGFVGLIVPHLVRMVWGTDYRRLLPLSMLCGAILLLMADILARLIIPPQEIPVGIITALGGAPFFLWVLRRTAPEAQG
ncbi:MAG: FecCD family ABC transporter permease [Anaerolineaceae bacterium]